MMFANGHEKYLSANHQNNSYSDDLWTKLHFCHGIANDSVYTFLETEWESLRILYVLFTFLYLL